mgnify:CR=1 FL=1
MKPDKKINFKYNLKLFFGFLSRYKSLVFLLLFLSFLSQASQVIDKFLLKAVIDNGTEFVKGSITKEDLAELFIRLIFFYALIVVSKPIIRWFHLHLLNSLNANLIVDLKRKFFNHIIYLSHEFHTTHKTGSLISRLLRGGNAIERLTDVMAFNISPLIFELIVVAFSIVYFDKTSALVVFLTAIVFISYSLVIQFKQQQANLKANQAEDKEKANMSDFFTNIDSIKYFGKENVIKNKYKKLSLGTRLASLKHWGYFRWLDSGHAFILTIGTFFLIYFPIIRFLNGEISLGTLVFIYTVFGNLMGPLFGFVYGIRGFYTAMADFESLFEYGKIQNEIKDKKDARKLKISKGKIEFRNVDFSYRERKIFSKFKLTVPASRKVALVGHSGSGKTTLVKLLYRFYDVNGGRILIDGKDISDFKQESLRSELSIVPQECVLFDDTIYNNIAFSNSSASRKDVLRAMKFAQLDKVINEFPKKENTIVGERGVRLSGGEKQRVSIARAILADKKVLVLDEATSSLDSKTEHEIQKDLEKLMKGRTSIIIAHRLSTIMKADIIVVMRKGKIVQIGKHKDLLNQAGPYKHLWNLQRGGYIK